MMRARPLLALAASAFLALSTALLLLPGARTVAVDAATVSWRLPRLDRGAVANSQGAEADQADRAPAVTGGPAPTDDHPAGTWWKPPARASWQLQGSGTPDLAHAVQLYDLDLFATSPATVAAIHSHSAKAICGVSTGIWEASRSDAARFPATVRGATVGGYPDQRYLNLHQTAALQPLIAARLDLCRSKGFDGVDPRADDTYLDADPQDVGFPVSYADQLGFDRMVAGLAHARGLAIGLRTGTSGDQATRFITGLEPITDFVVNERCAAADQRCAPLELFVQHGKPVLHAEHLSDYPGATVTSHQAALNRFCPIAHELGFSSILTADVGAPPNWRAACG
jgi:hypothetical protein